MPLLHHRRLSATACIFLLVFLALLAAPVLAAPQQGQSADGVALLANSNGNTTVEIELPEMEVRKKDKPLDEQIRVGLYLPTQLGPDPQAYSVKLEESKWQELFHRERSLVENDYLHLAAARVKISPTWGAAATLVTVHLSKPLSGRLVEVVRHLFPHTAVHHSSFLGDVPPEVQLARAGLPLCADEAESPEATTDKENLRIQVEMIPHLVERKEPIRVWKVLHPVEKERSIHVLERLDVEVKLTILDRMQRTVQVIDVVGAADVDGFTLNPSTDQWEDIGEEALLQVSDKLMEGLRGSQKLGTCLKKLVEPRSLPAGLVITAKLDDTASLFPNGRLDAGEEARLTVAVENKGPGPAYRVGVRTSSDQPEITVSGESTIGDLDPGGKKEAVLRVTGGLGLHPGLAKLRVEAVEKRGYEARPVEVEVATSQVLAPKLEIVDITLNDRGGRAVGDGDGQPGNGESIEAVVRVRNAGPGDGAGVAVTMVSPKVGAEILDPRVVLPRIAAGRVEEARLLFRLPFALETQELPLSFQAVDARGSQIGSAAKQQTWTLRIRRPGIALRVASYDGKSAGSIGNRDGEANNGERIEVVVTPMNSGELASRRVRIAVEPEDVLLKPQPAALEIGDLPAQAEGAAQRFILDIPREYRLERPAGELRLTLVVSQRDFPEQRTPISLRFRPLHPELVLESEAPALTRSSQGELFLRLRNAGGLRAEDVTVEVSTEAAGVDLLDERHVPGQSRRIAMGALDPQAAAPPTSVPIQIRRNAALGSTLLQVTVKQKGFPPLERRVAFAVTEETAEVVPFKPSEEPVRVAGTTAPMAPATISFLSHKQGRHLLEEAVELRFEIQSPGELSEVRLMRNDRQITLDGAEVSRSASPGLRGTAYQLPVPLADGENRFEVVVVTQQGLRSVRSLTLFRDHEVGRVWVVAVGVSKYQDPAIPGLRYADADARAVYDYFRVRLPESQVFLRVNEEATLREIKSLLGTQLATKAIDPKDTVILYFAGHGMRDRVTQNRDPYFLPYDARSNDLYSSALEMNEITGLLRRLIPERVVVLIDSCFSGAAGGRSPYDPKAEGDRALLSDEFLDHMAHAGKGRAVLTASGPDEAAQEDPDLGHGVFTYHLLEGLQGAADSIPAGEISPDGNITIFEVYRYISSKVNKATRGKQTPMLKAPDVAGEIILTEGSSHRQP